MPRPTRDKILTALALIRQHTGEDHRDCLRLPDRAMRRQLDTIASAALALPCLSATAAPYDRSRIREAITSARVRRATLVGAGRRPTCEGGALVARKIWIPPAVDAALDRMPNAPVAIRGALARLAGINLQP